MAIAYLLLLGLTLAGLRWTAPKADGSFVDGAHCMPVKGIMIGLVFLIHAGGYLYSDCGDIPGIGGWGLWCHGLSCIFGQLKVAPFLFFSGYGVAICLEKKGEAYLRGMPRNRILRTLIRFDVAVLAFIALNLALGIPMRGWQILFSFTGLDDVGNSNWYIFVILTCYSLMWFSETWARRRGKGLGASLAMLWALTLVALGILFCVKYFIWYNTILCFPAGVTYARYREQVNRRFFAHFWTSSALLLGATLGIHEVLGAVSFPGDHAVANLKAIVFCLLLVCLMTRLELRSRALTWMGENLFEIYIYQRIPMIVLITLAPGWSLYYRGWFVFISFAATVLGIVFARRARSILSRR